jgi:four helix bundle protein
MINQKYLHMETNKTHRDLDVWKVSMDLVIDLYRVTETFPKIEKYCLVTQIRRAGVSVCSNIAEGAGRFHTKEFLQFLYVSLGSVSEVETCWRAFVTRAYLYISSVTSTSQDYH